MLSLIRKRILPYAPPNPLKPHTLSPIPKETNPSLPTPCYHCSTRSVSRGRAWPSVLRVVSVGLGVGVIGLRGPGGCGGVPRLSEAPTSKPGHGRAHACPDGAPSPRCFVSGWRRPPGRSVTPFDRWPGRPGCGEAAPARHQPSDLRERSRQHPHPRGPCVRCK